MLTGFIPAPYRLSTRLQKIYRIGIEKVQAYHQICEPLVMKGKLLIVLKALISYEEWLK